MNIKCECGKRMVVSDALAGKTVRCSACGEGIFVAALPPQAAGGKAGNQKQPEAAGVYISPRLIGGAVALAVLLLIGLAFYLGPIRVGRQWDSIDMKARNSVMNVITFALKAYLSEQGEYDPAHHAPAIESTDLSFNRPLLAMSMPAKVRFDGRSNNGGFTGFYNTETGEVEADVECGGYTVAGMVNLRKPTALFHMTAHEVNNDPVVQVAGRTLKIINPPRLDGKLY